MADIVKLQTPTVRLSFPQIATPREGRNGGKAKYGASLILDMESLSQRDKERLGAMLKAAKDALREKFGDKAFDADGKVRSNFKMPFRDGAEKAEYEGYGDGKKFFAVTTTRRPGLAIAVRDGNSARIEDTDEAERFYPGCYVQAIVNPYTYDTDGNRGVAFGLQHLIFIRDGENLGSASASTSEAVSAESIDASELQFDEASGGSDGGIGDLI